MCNNVRDIIIVKNLIFNQNGKGVVDHAWCKGRPCIIIKALDDSIYVLPLSTQIKNTDNRFFIKKNDIAYDYKHEGNKKDTEACFDSVVKINICGRMKIGTLNESTFYRMLRCMFCYNSEHEEAIDNSCLDNTLSNNIREVKVKSKLK